MTAEPTPPFEPAGSTNSLAVLVERTKARVKTYRVPLFGLAATLFAVGFAVSVSQLELALADISWFFICLSAVLFIPVAFFYGAINFMIMARGAGVEVTFASAFKTSCVAQFAEFLPVPGGAIVRGGALMRQGSGAASAAAHVTVNAILWVACAGAATAFSLGWKEPISIAIGLAGITGIAACTVWLSVKAGVGLAIVALAMRVVGLFIAGARILAGFLAIGVVIELTDLYPFVFASILGSAASIAPGGLGISEAVAAALATLTTIPPEAAFVAVALNRIIGFGVSGLATGVIAFVGPSQGGGK